MYIERDTYVVMCIYVYVYIYIYISCITCNSISSPQHVAIASNLNTAKQEVQQLPTHDISKQTNNCYFASAHVASASKQRRRTNTKP